MISTTTVTTLFPVTVLFTLSLSSLMFLQGVLGGNIITIDPSHNVHHLNNRRHLRNRIPENIDELGREKIGGLVYGNLDRISASTTTATTTTATSASPSDDTNTNDDAILSSFLQNSGTLNEVEVVEIANTDTEEELREEEVLRDEEDLREETDVREEEDNTFTSTAIITKNNQTPSTTTTTTTTTTTKSKNNTNLFTYIASAVVALVVLVSVIAIGLFVGLRYRNRRDRIDAKKMKQKPLAGPDTSDDRYKYKENGSVYENNTTTFDDSENTDTDTDPGIVRNHRGVVSRLVCSSSAAHSCTRQQPQQQDVAKNNNTDPTNEDMNNDGDQERKQNKNDP